MTRDSADGKNLENSLEIFHFVVYCLPSVMWWFQDSAETADPHDGAQKKSIKYTNAKHNKKKLNGKGRN